MTRDRPTRTSWWVGSVGADAELIAFGVLEGCPVETELFLGVPDDAGAQTDQPSDLLGERLPALGMEVDVTRFLADLGSVK